ncbi:DUF4886 domain-containing protein [Bacteroides gallinaceum]|uniref:DUF4886 domain-containing protein n=1 Tax=Bacteroides gallinaceum TaxID=1462571 RepID=UPI001956A50C|nr:DUF4886 domain-containing protein [Bacteroides gallinaceum]MBM6657542.1 DUF4886 domain-containing protein [Bacteroides gallinaceum]
MATKTFEELKQLAIQIRDEKTNKQNTATRIGTQMLEHLEKLEQDYYDKNQTDEELKERDDKLIELSDNVFSPIKEIYVTGVSELSSPTFNFKKKTDGKLYFNATSKGEIIAAGAWGLSDLKDYVVKSYNYQEKGIYFYLVIDAEDIPLDDDNYYSYLPKTNPFNIIENPSIYTYLNVSPKITDNTLSIENGYRKPTFFLNTNLDKYFKVFYIDGLDNEKEYCLRTLRLNEDGESPRYQINIGDDSSSIIQILINVGEISGEIKYGNITARAVLQNTDEIVGNLIFGNTNTSIGTLNKIVCEDIANSPTCKNTALYESILKLKDDIVKDNNIFFNDKLGIGRYIKELYTNGFSEDTEYCLRTFGWNSALNAWQVNIGTSDGSFVEVRCQDSVVSYRSIDNKGKYAAILLENTDELSKDSYLLFGNTDTSLYTINKTQATSKNLNPKICIEKEPFFIDSPYNKYFKEIYIEGLDDKAYCLRTLRWNPDKDGGVVQVTIGDESSAIIETYVYRDNEVSIRDLGTIKAYIVFNGFEEIKNNGGNLIFANTNVNKGSLNRNIVESFVNQPNINTYFINSEIDSLHKYDSVRIPPAYNGYSLPKNPQTLKVLHVGNSFADQPISKLQMWLDALGIQNVIYGIVMRAGGSLQQHLDTIVNDTPYDENSAFRLYKNINGETTYTPNVDPTDKSGSTTTNNQIKLSDCLQFTDWDVITFQQASWASGKWETIEPYLPNLIKYARYYCSNSGVKIGWQMTWAYAKGYTGLSSYNNSQDEMFKEIVQCAKNVCSYYGIDLIIPNGIVVQNLRNVPSSFWGDALNSIRGAEQWTSGTPVSDFTDDGMHPNDIAEYCTSAAFVMLIYGACYNKTIRGINATLGNISGDYAKVARQCVLKAVGDRFNVSEIDVSKILE